jgi:hypothetical protein
MNTTMKEELYQKKVILINETPEDIAEKDP